MSSDERIPDELLPGGVGPAWWSPEATRLHAEAKCRSRFDHTMEVKAWVVLHLLNERDRHITDTTPAPPDALAETERIARQIRLNTKTGLGAATGKGHGAQGNPATASKGAHETSRPSSAPNPAPDTTPAPTWGNACPACKGYPDQAHTHSRGCSAVAPAPADQGDDT